MKQIPKINRSELCYVNITRHWRQIKPVIKSPEAEHIWRTNMEDFEINRAHDNGYKLKSDDYKKFDSPCVFDSSDWRFTRPGISPEWWDFVCYRACHYLVDLNLFVAMKVFPRYEWRILTQKNHSTVWDGELERPMLFDMNFSALQIDPRDAWGAVTKGRMLKSGNPLNWHRYIGKELFV